MRLVRIEAGRFGKIDGRTLGDLSPGLTVVHGPNEAGKSSLMALVRHVLYGFPTKGDAKEAPYLSDAGAREGRLVFADDDGEWVVERREGVRGGPVTVRTLSGRPRDGLVDQLTAGVSRLAYRVVLGFGLAEMQQIEELKGRDDDLIARLYAAGAGLEVSPIDVRAKLETSMDALWAKRASNPVLNRTRARRDELRGEIRALEAEGEMLRTDGARLETMDRDADSARAARTQAQVAVERAARAVTDAERLIGDAAMQAQEADRLDVEARAARAASASLTVDEAALAAADTVDVLASELSGFRERVASLSNEQSRLVQVESRMRAALADAGWSEECALAAAADAGVAAEIDAAREALATARGRAASALEARDRARAESGEAEPVSAVRPWLVPGIATGVLGGIGLVVGIISGQFMLAVFAGVLVLAGAVLALFPAGGSRATSGGVARQRPGASDAGYAAAEAALAKQTASWAEWVRARALGDGSEDPKAIAARYQAARAVHAAAAERSLIVEAATRETDHAQAYADRVIAVTCPLLGEAPGSVTLDRVPELVSRTVAKVAEARAAAAARADASARAERLETDAQTARERASSASAGAAKALEGLGVAAGDLDGARAIEAAARADAADAVEEYDRISREATALRTSLGAERRETALSEARLEDETLGERIADGVREYAVLAVAARLLSLAQERYERDRQPEVVKNAEAAFAAMTNGRYTRLAVPLGKDAIEVFDASAAATSPGKLSRGTAEQLYLALRLGLIEQLGDAGRGLPVLMDDILVDFSPDRLEPAARAIADLATRRQVVFLTCHPATAELLCRVAPDAVRLELERQG